MKKITLTVYILFVLNIFKLSAQCASPCPDLSALAGTTAANSSIVAGTDNSLELGTATLEWRNLYLGNTLFFTEPLANVSNPQKLLYINGIPFIHNTGGGTLIEGWQDQGTFLGLNAGASASTSNNGCVGIGYYALNAMVVGNHNTANGWRALFNLNGTGGGQGDKNTMVGSRAGEFITIGSENTGIGWNVFYKGTGTSTIKGTGNIGIGGALTIAGGNSVGVLGSLDDGNYNTVLGHGSGTAIVDGSNNTIVGRASGTAITTGSNNIILGDNAGVNLAGNVGGTAALRNTIIGSSAGNTLTEGNDNIIIGSNTDQFSGAAASNQLNIGNTIYGDLASDEISIGSTATSSMFNVGNDNQFQVNLNGRINNYNGIATFNNGVPSQVAVVNLANQSATIPASTVLYTSAAEGFYRISYIGVITTAAFYSSGAPASSSLSLRVKYNDPNLATDVVVPAANLDPINSYTSNSVGGNFSGSMLIYVEAGSNITYKATYLSDPAAPATAPDANMVYSLRIVVEKL